ncbi:hypothetical protein COCON_G00055060 [Conger conger]|uniref:BRCT domain-containing protein n=1 Tax=Conger conger TaxID=82655 RepID=A0A9Q1I469_CONCO|nr:hypothetical protein COCON_G00055060 [Conger conger]
MDHGSDVDQKTCAWTKTRQAVAQFRDLLLCAKCSKLMSEPVCFGACEHMFCRTCAGVQIRDGCCICHSPAWVRDIQVNRQLNNITQLFHDLDCLLNPRELSATPPAGSPLRPDDAALRRPGKSVKIWFSPRSRKVRCQVERAGECAPQGRGPGKKKRPLGSPGPRPVRLQLQLLLPGLGELSAARRRRRRREAGGAGGRAARGKRKRPQSSPRPATRGQTQTAVRREKLAAINKEWGFGCPEERTVAREGGRAGWRRGGGGGGGGGGPERTPAQQEEAGSASAGEPVPVQNQNQNQNLSPPVAKTADPAVLSPKPTTPPPPSSSARRASKRALPPGGAQPESTPKRRRSSPGQGRRPVAPAPPSACPSPDFESPVRRSAKDPGTPLGSPRTPGRGSPAGPGLLRGSPAYLKRNHKGETPLHLAAIKVRKAGHVWALELPFHLPLPSLFPSLWSAPEAPAVDHEACNLGHQAVVEALLLKGALLNTPGYHNDSPLHDAVRNGHVTVVRLLLEQGASRDVLNMFGLRPGDYAETEEMREILQAPSEGPHTLDTPLSPNTSLSKVTGGSWRDGPVAFLGSKLTAPQRKRLTKLGRLLGAQGVDSFSSSVTHVVVPEGPIPTTLSCLRGVLNGCWVLRFSWVEACLKSEDWADESEFEAGEGPQRSRLNRDNLLPRLFDGCFFFLLGPFKSPSREELLQLVREGGGQVLTRQPKPDSDVTQTLTAAAYHARPGSDQSLSTQYILYHAQSSHRPPRVRLGKVWSAPTSWLLDCIVAFQLLPVPEL